ncbi:MAG: hypothetical protein JXR50_04345 [Prolixibacteraceae bacterium]|nr:hypothetical protein [Prolixibacteraceae bacterium]
MKRIPLIAFAILLLLLACDEDHPTPVEKTNSYSVTGKVQKGPFVKGSSITINELNQALGQTGKTFTTLTNSDAGNFSIDNMELNSSMVQITATGYSFCEIYGEPHTGTITLQALADLSVSDTVNVNVLTHLCKGRVETLMENGSSFVAARDSAMSEISSFMGDDKSLTCMPGELDISKNSEDNAMLLAFFIMLQRFTYLGYERPQLSAEVSELLSELSEDFEPDGKINDQRLIDTLIYNISQLNLRDVRSNVENKYIDLEGEASIPEFEKNIIAFQKKHSNGLCTFIEYPEMASPKPEWAPEAKIPNLLAITDSVIDMNQPYSLAAIIPLDATLTIKFINTGKTVYSLDYPQGWESINDFPNGFTLIAQKQNTLISTMIDFYEDEGEATIEYYENGDVLTDSKKIRWVNK